MWDINTETCLQLWFIASFSTATHQSPLVTQWFALTCCCLTSFPFKKKKMESDWQTSRISSGSLVATPFPDWCPNNEWRGGVKKKKKKNDREKKKKTPVLVKDSSSCRKHYGRATPHWIIQWSVGQRRDLMTQWRSRTVERLVSSTLARSLSPLLPCFKAGFEVPRWRSLRSQGDISPLPAPFC